MNRAWYLSISHTKLKLMQYSPANYGLIPQSTDVSSHVSGEIDIITLAFHNRTWDFHDGIW